MLAYVVSGLTFGLAAGVSPGPLLAFLVTQTLRYGVREGVRVALAPLLTDAPIVAAALLILSRLANLGGVLGGISLAGGLYLVWLGVESLRVHGPEISESEASPHSIRKAMAINLLNPHVYVFWATVGAPTVLRASRTGVATAIAFVSCFYVLLCGSKALLAVLIHRSRKFLQGVAYRRTIQGLGLALIGFGCWLLWDGVRYLSGQA